MHTNPVDDATGDFSEWKPDDRSCRCGGDVEYRAWDSSDGGHTDYNYRCVACKRTWWIDGCDS